MAAERIPCPRCGATILAYDYLELDPTPDPRGCYALDRTGTPVVAVTFARGKITGRAKGYETAPLYRSHNAVVCATTTANNAQLLDKAPKKARAS